MVVSPPISSRASFMTSSRAPRLIVARPWPCTVRLALRIMCSEAGPPAT
jgi:hypothetical protein